MNFQSLPLGRNALRYGSIGKFIKSNEHNGFRQANAQNPRHFCILKRQCNFLLKIAFKVNRLPALAPVLGNRLVKCARDFGSTHQQKRARRHLFD